MWRRIVAVILVMVSFVTFGNAAYSFGYLGFSGFASQQSVQQLVINGLEDQINRVTIRWCTARKMNNVDAFELASKQLRQLSEQYREATGGKLYSPTCMELLIDG